MSASAACSLCFTLLYFCSALPADVSRQITADVNKILEHEKIADKKRCISEHIAPHSEEYYATMTVEDMLAIGRLSQQIGKEYFNKLLGVTNGVAKMTTAIRLDSISHQCSRDMASWDGEEPCYCKHPPTEQELQMPRLPPLSRGQPASATEAEGQSKANAVKAAVVKAAVVGAQSWVEQQEEGEGKAEQGR